MTKKTKPQTLKGFRDFLPEDMVIRQKVINTLKAVFESYGFEPVETPSLEYSSTLLGNMEKMLIRWSTPFEIKEGGR